MKINKLELANFLSYKDCTLDLSKLSLCSVVGEMGAGKSTIIEAILWALFGSAKLPNKDLIRSGTEETGVDLSFTIDGNNYFVSRTYGESMRVKASMNGEWIAQGNVNLAAALAKAIGSSKELLTESVVISQGQLSSFISATPAARRDLIISILGLNKYSMAWDTAKESLRTMQNTVESHNTNVSMIQEQLSKIPEQGHIDTQIVLLTGAVEEANKKFGELTRRKEELLSQDREVSEGIKTFSAEAERIKNKIDRIMEESVAEIDKIETALRMSDRQTSDLNSLKSSLPVFEEQLQQAIQVVERLKELRAQINTYEGELKKRRDRLAIVSTETETCPLCGNHITADKWNEIVKGMRDELVTFSLKLDEASREVQGAKMPGDPDKIRGSISFTRERISKLETMQDSRQILVDQLESLKKKREEAVKELQDQLAHTNDKVTELRARVNTELVSVMQEVESIQRTQIEHSSKLVEWSSLKKSRERTEDSLTDAKNNLGLFREKLPETKFITDALSPSGIPLMIIDHYLPLIEARAKDLLNDMSDGKLTLKLDVVETGSKKGVELYAGSDHLRPIRSLSGGEGTRVSLALRIALSQILSQISGCKFDCLFVDEPEYLSDTGIDQLIRAIVSLRSQYQQIFVMSHHTKMKTAFPQIIHVEKQGNVSHAEVQS